MDADERLIALKRAYADIILNMSKEAAARVVVSETKAFRVEKELKEFKGQALQMLLRSKKMMDCKVLEAEMTSFNQQKMIQELNGQLQDATDRICKAEVTSLSQNKKIDELEAQLNEAEDIVNDLREDLKVAHTELKRVRKNKPQSNETFVTATKKTEVNIENLNGGTPNLLTSTPEENTLNTSQPIISSFFPDSHQKIPSLTNANFSPRNELCIGNSNERKAFIPSILLKSKGPEFCGNRRTQRIRAFEEKLMAGELSFTDRTHDVDASYERNSKEDGGEAGDTCCVEKKVLKVGAHGRKWRKFAKCKTKKTSTRDLHNRSREIEETHNSLSEEEPFNTVPEGNIEEKTPFAHEKAGASTNEEFLENEIADSTMNKGVVDVEKVDMSAVTLETATPGTADGIDDQPVTERVFKYTFQRKRKREYPSYSDGCPLGEEAVLKKSTAERPNCPQEMEKCGSLVESSRDSRRLALVAHQLISLSERKW